MNNKIKINPIVLLILLFVSCVSKPEAAGTFAQPLPLDVSAVRYDERNHSNEIALAVLEVLRGADAEQFAAESLDAESLPPLADGAEYLTVKVIFDIKHAPASDTLPLYPHWHVVLREENAGEDIAIVNWRDMAMEAVPPYSAETWLFFIVHKDSQPLLYFQPYRIYSSEEFRNSGAYFSLNAP